MRKLFRSSYWVIGLIFSLIFFLFAVSIIFSFSYIFGHKVLEGGLLGGDTPFHFAWLHTLERYFPKVPFWFPFAGGGQSIVLGYWVLPYYLAIIGSRLSTFSVDQMFRILEFLVVPLISLQIYLYLWIRLKNQVVALLGALLYPLSSISWGWIVYAGFYNMHLSTATFLLPFLFYDLYLEEELNISEKKTRRRFFLLGFCLTIPVTILMHGNSMPSLFLGLPLYTLLRSQFSPRKIKNRVISAFMGARALVIFVLLGLLASSFFLIPQMRHFSFQAQAQGQAFSYGGDLARIPWRVFLGFERPNPLVVGSLHEGIFLSLLVTIFAIIGLVSGLLRRNFLAAMGITAFFYVWWIDSTQILQENLPFLSRIITLTNVRSASVAAIYITIIAAYGIWSLAGIPGDILKFAGKELGKIGGKVGKIFEFGLDKFAFIVTSILAVLLSVWAFYDFRNRQSFPPEVIKGAVAHAYFGYGTATMDVPFCMAPGWEKELSQKDCDKLKPAYFLTRKFEIGGSEADVTGNIENVLSLNPFTRVSISPFLGSFMYSFNDHGKASMVQTQSSLTTSISDWIGFHNDIFFFKGQKTTPEEVEDVAKWFGVKYVFLNPSYDEQIFDRYTKDKWKDIGGVGPATKEFTEDTGIVHFSNKPAVLIIGSLEKKAYTQVFRVLTKSGRTFDRSLIVKGGEKIDDYTAYELGKFSTIILHGYKYKNSKKSWKLLSEFVQKGGNLFIDTGWQFVSKDWGSGPDKRGDYLQISLPEPFPVKKTQWGIIKNQSEGKLQTDLGEGLKIENFGDFSWSNRSWGVAFADKNNLQPWAEPILVFGNKVVIARGTLGKGKVVWSGMNLFNHSYTKESKEEFRFIDNIFNYLVPKGTFEEGEFKAKWDFPDRVEFTLTKIPGKTSYLYFADSYTPDWKAYLLDKGSKKRLKIYQAGPGFKAVRLEGLKGNEKLIFEYSIRNIIIASVLISLTTFIAILVSIIDSVFWRNALERKISRTIFGNKNLISGNILYLIYRKLTNSLNFLKDEES